MGGSAFINNIEYKEFDNFYNCQFYIDNLLWNSSEQAYQALKFDDKQHILKINQETDMSMIIHLGHVTYIKYIEGYSNNTKENINNNPFLNNPKISLMYKVNLEKFKQNPHLLEILKKTTGEVIFKNSNSFWRKWNGKIIEKIRYDLK